MPQPLIFLSHSSKDKGRIKPLALAFLKEGFRLFIDKPTKLNFDAAFCDDNGIEFIPEGTDWSDQINYALKRSDATLGCLSKMLMADSKVWDQEITFSFQRETLATCIVDGTRSADLAGPANSLVEIKKLQSHAWNFDDNDPMEQVPDKTVEALRLDVNFKSLVHRLRSIAQKTSTEKPVDRNQYVGERLGHDQSARPHQFGRDHLNVLMMMASPKNTHRLRLDEEVRELNEKLSLIRDPAKAVTIASAWAVQSDKIQTEILNSHPEILHFSGHGSQEGLCFEDASGDAVDVSGDAIAGIVEAAGSIECVILNACYSESIGRAICAHAKFVAGCTNAIEDDAAIAFSEGFYSALGRGKPYPDAFKLGVNQIKLRSMDQEAAKYVLLGRTDAGDIKVLHGRLSPKADATESVVVDHLDVCVESDADRDVRRQEACEVATEAFLTFGAEIWSEFEKHYPELRALDNDAKASCLASQLLDLKPKDAHELIGKVRGSFSKRKSSVSTSHAETLSIASRTFASAHPGPDADPWVGWIRTVDSKGKFSSRPVAGSFLKAEIASAAADGRSVQTNPRKAVVDFPSGTHRINFPAVEGHDPNGEKQRTAILKALERSIGLDLGSFLSQLEQQIKPKLFPNDRTESVDTEQLREALRVYGDTDAIFYMTIPVNVGKNELLSLYKLIGSVMAEIPEIRCIAIDTSQMRQDRSDLAYFVQSLELDPR